MTIWVTPYGFLMFMLNVFDHTFILWGS